MSNDSFRYYYCLYIWYFTSLLCRGFCWLWRGREVLHSIQWQAAESQLVIMTSCHGECCLQCKSLNHQIIATASFATDSIIIIQTKARTYKHWRYSSKIAHAKKVELEYLAVLWLCEGVWYSKFHFSYLLNSRLMDCIHDGRSDDFDVLKQGWIQHDLVGGGGVLCQLWYRVVTVMCAVRPSTCLTTAKSCLTIVFEL